MDKSVDVMCVPFSQGAESVLKEMELSTSLDTQQLLEQVKSVLVSRFCHLYIVPSGPLQNISS